MTFDMYYVLFPDEAKRQKLEDGKPGREAKSKFSQIKLNRDTVSLTETT
jgi:hypothetical protein